MVDSVLNTPWFRGIHPKVFCKIEILKTKKEALTKVFSYENF